MDINCEKDESPFWVAIGAHRNGCRTELPQRGFSMSPLRDKKRRRSPMTATVQSTFRICGNDDTEKVSDATRIGEDHKGGSVLTIQFFHPLQSNGGKLAGHRFGTEISSTYGCEKWNRSKTSMEYHLEFGQNMAGIGGWNRLFHRKIKEEKS